MPKLTGFPSLEPAYVLKLVVGEGTPVGEIYSGSTFVHYSTPGGSITTVPGFSGPQINADIVFAGDWIYFDPDKKQTRMNVKGVAKTPEGAVSGLSISTPAIIIAPAGINFAYTGVSKVSDEVAEIFNHNPKTIAFGSSTTTNTFEVGSADLKGLETATWAGNGRFLMEEGVFKVETRISRVIASTDID